MTDISKLKEEADQARNEAQDWIFDQMINTNIDSYGKAGQIADALIRATIAQIALQAAEKEAGSANVRMAMQNIVLVDPAPIADDTWIKWEGGECPGDMRVLVKYRDGRTSKKDYLANNYLWQHDGTDDDIIAYRIIQPAADRVEES